MKTIDDLRTALNYPSPVSTPDTAGLIAKGRRRKLATRATAGAGTVAVAGLAVLALQVVGGPSATAPLDGTAPNPVLVAAATTLASEAPEQFDPLRRTLHVGWIPAGLGQQLAEVTPWEQLYGGHDAAYVNGGPDLGLLVTVLAKGRPVTDFASGAPGLPSDPVAQATDAINGGAADCLTDPAVPGSCSAIRWQYAPSAWAQVSYAGTAGPTPALAAAVARQVAESVTLTEGESVRMPFTLDGELAGMSAIRSLVAINSTPGLNGEAWSADLELVPAGTVVQPGVRGLDVSVSYNPTDPSGRIDRDSQPNTTVNGHPAWLQADGAAVVVWGASDTRSVAEYANGGDALAAYADVTLLPNPVDPAGWPPID